MDNTNKYLPLLMEARRRLLFLVCLFVIASALGFFYYERIIKFALAIFQFQGVNIVFTSPFQFINLAINSSLVLGLAVTMPFIIVQVLFFVKPALAPQEYRTLLFLLPFGLVLFAIGFIYGIMMMRTTLEIFYHQTQAIGAGNFLDISTFLFQILLTAILLGTAFQFPLVFTFLLHLKVVKLVSLVKSRLIFYLAAGVFVIFLPPTDLLSNFLLFLPLALLFELTLILNRFVFKNI